MKKRLFSGLLALVMVLSLLPATALAADPPAIADRYVVDGVTYFNANSTHFRDSTALFIRDLLLKNVPVESIGNYSTAAAWQYLASFIQEDYGHGINNPALKTALDEAIAEGLATGYSNRLDDDGYSYDNLNRGGNTYNVRSSILKYASSMAKAAEAMEAAIYDGYKGAGGSRNQYNDNAAKAAVAQNEALWGDTDPDDVYWVVTGAYKTSGSNQKGHYQALGVLFSDFALTTILPKDNGNFIQSSNSEQTAGTPYASQVKNMTGASVSAQQEISNTTSITATSEINGSEAYGFEEGLEVGVEADFLFGSVSTNVSFTASQTIESGWSEAKSCSDEQTTTYNVSVELPPYTNVMMKQNTSEATTATVYNCPVALSFTVTVVEYTLDPSSSDAACQTQVLATFGSNARKDLKQRAVIESSLTDRDGINWGSLLANHIPSTDLEATMTCLTATAPMSSAGATFKVVDKAVTSEISGLSPILALSKVKTTKNIMEYNLSSGEYLYVDTIGLEGLNAQNAPYYGFNQDQGHWILLDENGNALESNSNSVAKLEPSSVSGHTKLIAGDTDGTVYLKYLIDEDVYATAENPTVFRKNENLASTAVIEVHVSGKQFDGSINVMGELTGIVGDPAKPIDNDLTAIVMDATGKEISRPVEWEAQLLPSRGIKIEENQISFTKAGTFKVRAKIVTENKTVYSDWYTVNALPARKLSVIQIPDTYSFDYKSQQTLNLAGLMVSYKDQYGADWTDIPTLTWTCTDEGVTISDGVLMVPSAGVYTVTASAGGITSNPLTITVTDTSRQVTSMSPATKSLPAAGGSVEFTITGTGLTNGIVLKANDSITATTTGTDTKQKATLVFPANTDTGNDKTYTVTNSLDDSITATVTVAKKAASSSGSGSGSGSGTGDGGGAVPAGTVTIQPSLNGKVTADNISAAEGATVTLTVQPDAGYTLAALTVTVGNGSKLTLVANGNGKYTFTMPASNVTVTATFSKDTSVPGFFVDVPASEYYYNAVLWAVEKGITSGTGDGTTFSPNATCTRAQAVTFLWRAAGSPAPKSSNMPFTDVAAGSYYYNAVLWAVENGITTGTGDTTFSPDATCSRGQIVTFLWRSQNSPAAGSVNPFADVKSDDYYANAVLWAVKEEITTGTSDTTFSPANNCTRAQIVTFLWRALAE